jgi:hypothetical protein
VGHPTLRQKTWDQSFAGDNEAKMYANMVVEQAQCGTAQVRLQDGVLYTAS